MSVLTSSIRSTLTRQKMSCLMLATWACLALTVNGSLPPSTCPAAPRSGSGLNNRGFTAHNGSNVSIPVLRRPLASKRAKDYPLANAQTEKVDVAPRSNTEAALGSFLEDLDEPVVESRRRTMHTEKPSSFVPLRKSLSKSLDHDAPLPSTDSDNASTKVEALMGGDGQSKQRATTIRPRSSSTPISVDDGVPYPPVREYVRLPQGYFVARPEHREVARPGSDWVKRTERYCDDKTQGVMGIYTHRLLPAAIKSAPLGHFQLASTIRDEIALIEKLAHPFIVRSLGLFEDQSQGAVMMIIEGTNEQDISRLFLDAPSEDGEVHRPRPGMSERLRAIRHTILAVAHLHQHDYAHKDLKLENIIRLPNGVYKLIDFGTAERLGTLSFMDPQRDRHGDVRPYRNIAPESFQKSMPVAPQQDFYSLAVVIYETLTGREAMYASPFRLEQYADSVDRIVKDVSDLFKDRRQLGVELPQFLRRMLDLDPNVRMSSFQNQRFLHLFQLVPDTCKDEHVRQVLPDLSLDTLAPSKTPINYDHKHDYFAKVKSIKEAREPVQPTKMDNQRAAEKPLPAPRKPKQRRRSKKPSMPMPNMMMMAPHVYYSPSFLSQPRMLQPPFVQSPYHSFVQPAVFRPSIMQSSMVQPPMVQQLHSWSALPPARSASAAPFMPAPSVVGPPAPLKVVAPPTRTKTEWRAKPAIIPPIGDVVKEAGASFSAGSQEDDQQHCPLIVSDMPAPTNSSRRQGASRQTSLSQTGATRNIPVLRGPLAQASHPRLPTFTNNSSNYTSPDMSMTMPGNRPPASYHPSSSSYYNDPSYYNAPTYHYSSYGTPPVCVANCTACAWAMNSSVPSAPNATDSGVVNTSSLVSEHSS